MSNRTTLLRLSTLSLVVTMATPPAAGARQESPQWWHEPRIIYVDQPTSQAREIVAWAVEQFHQAGLQLPDLEISFPPLCSGKGALYHVGKRSIDFCRINKHRAVHEFAHAWDDTSGDVDHDAFLELRGLSVWWGGTEMPSSEQGAEQLAQIITWGLMGFLDRDIPQFSANSVRELTEAYAMLTNRSGRPNAM